MRTDLQCFCMIARLQWRLAWRSMADIWQCLAFFVLVVCLFPLALGSDVRLLQTIGSGVIWVAALLSILIALGQGFREDMLDGTLESWLVSPYPISWLVFAKITSRWLIVALPMLFMVPIMGLMFRLSWHEIVVLFYSLLLGTPILYLLGSIFSALTVGFASNSWLMALLLLPLTVPTLIFGCGACAAVALGVPYQGQLAILGAMLVLALVVVPWVCAVALRVGVLHGVGSN